MSMERAVTAASPAGALHACAVPPRAIFIRGFHRVQARATTMSAGRSCPQCFRLWRRHEGLLPRLRLSGAWFLIRGCVLCRSLMRLVF